MKDRYTDFYRYVSVCAGIPLGHGKLLEFQEKISFLNFASACKQAYNFIRVSSLFLKKDDTAGILPVLQIIPFISLFGDVTSFKCCNKFLFERSQFSGIWVQDIDIWGALNKAYFVSFKISHDIAINISAFWDIYLSTVTNFQGGTQLTQATYSQIH